MGNGYGANVLHNTALQRQRAMQNRLAFLEARVIELESELRTAELRARLANLTLQEHGLRDIIPFASFVGERLRAERHRMGFTQYDLADITGYPQGQIAQWETGVYKPHWHAAYDLAIALETEMSAFLAPIKDTDNSHIIRDRVMDLSGEAA